MCLYHPSGVENQSQLVFSIDISVLFETYAFCLMYLDYSNSVAPILAL